MTTQHTETRTQALSLLLAVMVALSATAGLAGMASAATTTDLTVSITDDDDTIAPGETTTVDIAVTDVDGGVGAAELGIELSDPGVAAITDVTVPNAPGNTDNNITGGGQSADVKYAFASEADDDGVVIVEVTLQAAAAGSTDIDIVENSQTGNLVVFDEGGAGYTLANVGSATLTVNTPPEADAGGDQTVEEGTTVTLDGSASSDDDGDSLSYSWTQTDGPSVSLSDTTAAQPTFTAPSVSADTTLDFELEVSDGTATDTDSVSVTVQPSEPAAADFQVSNLQAPGSATQGDAIDVSADVENTGGQTATKSVEFRVDTDGDDSIDDESALASQDVELDAGTSTTVTFEDVDTSGLAPGTYTHGVVTADDSATAQITINAPAEANFQVSDLSAPSSAEQGDLIDVSADVENTGGQTATKSVEFRIDANGDGLGDSGDVVLSEDVELAPGESTTVTFEGVDTSGLAPGTYTHGVVTADDSATAQITIEDADQPAPPAGETTVSLQPADQTGAVGATTTYEVVVDNAAGGVGAAEIAVTVDDTSLATITGVEVLHGATADTSVTDSTAEFDYFGADTGDTGSVVIAEVTVEGAGVGTADLSVGPADGNGEVLLFDESGDGYTVTGTNGATLEVLPVQFQVSNLSAPEKAAVGSTVTVTADVTSDGDVESTQPVEFQIDVDGDGTLETVATEQVTIDGGETVEVSFDVTVPEDASFGERDHGVFTVADNETATIEFTPPAVGDGQGLPGDTDGDGLYEDVNGDGNVDTGDAQSLFANRDADAMQDHLDAFDFNGDGAVNVGDAQVLFDLVTEN